MSETEMGNGGLMRCPDCGHDFPVKPEVVVQKEPCRCGLTEFARCIRYIAIGIVLIIGGILLSSLYSDYTLQKIIGEPSIKVKITDYDASGRPIKELTR